MWKVNSGHGGGRSGGEHDGVAQMENGKMGVTGTEKGKPQKAGTDGWRLPL